MSTEHLVFKPEIVEDSEITTGDEEYVSLLLKVSLKPKQKILLVLSINGLIFDGVDYKNKGAAPKKHSHNFVSGNFRIYMRPFFKEFLEFCMERFEVGLWSSVTERKIVDRVMSKIGTELKSKLLFVWDNKQCTESDYSVMNTAKIDSSDKPLFVKELKKIWEKWANGVYSSANTLLIDNDSSKGILNPPHTGIFPPKYNANMIKDKFLSRKGELQMYLKGLEESNEDVPSYVKNHPFGDQPMKHPSWRSYYKVIAEFVNDQEDQASTSSTSNAT